MSEYKPITGELREAMVRWGWCESDGTITVSSTPPNIEAEPFLTIVGSRFDHLCDTIDSVHESLEAECERLREQHDKQTVGELLVRVHLDYSDMAQQLEWAAQAVRNIGGDAE